MTKPLGARSAEGDDELVNFRLESGLRVIVENIGVTKVSRSFVFRRRWSRSSDSNFSTSSTGISSSFPLVPAQMETTCSSPGTESTAAA